MLLATKLFVPQAHPNLVTRPRLLKLLDDDRTSKLTLISAPAGFGKTTLVTEWIAKGRQGDRETRRQGEVVSPHLLVSLSPPPSVAWLSLDEGDNDPIRFVSYLLAALQKVDATIGASVTVMLQSPQPPKLDLLMTLLVNELTSIQSSFVLVLDDYHVITAQSIHDALAFLVEQMPPCLKLIITTRSDPPLPLSRWRVRRQMTEIRQRDLRFSEEEAALFLNDALNIRLSSADVKALENRTEGWIAGLQLAALSLRQQENVSTFVQHFTGSNAFVIDYLVEEVLQNQPQKIVDFLLQTAILDRFCGALCDAITGRTDGQMVLEQLGRANLFLIELDDRRQWFRYHHLFAEVLKNRLQKQAATTIPSLHRNAARWFAEQDLRNDAIEHAFAAADDELTATLIEQSLEQLTKRGEVATLAKWLETLPRQVCLAHPKLALAYSNGLIIRHQLEQADTWLQQLADQFNTATSPSLQAELFYQRAHAASRRYDFASVINYAEHALQLVAKDDFSLLGKILLVLGLAYYYVRGIKASLSTFEEATRVALQIDDFYIALYGINNQAEVLAKMGRLSQAIAAFQQGLQLASEHSLEHLSVTSRLHDGLSLVLYEVDDLAGMQRHLELALTQRYWLNPLRDFENQVALAKLKFARNELALALETLERALAKVTQQQLPEENTSFARQLRVYLWLALGRNSAAIDWAQASGLGIEDELSIARQWEYIALVRTLLLEKNHHAALRLLDRLIEMVSADDQEATLVELLALRALVLDAAGDANAAHKSLAAAVVRGQRDGFIRSFVGLGEPMQRLLLRYRQTIQRSPGDPQSLALQSYLDRLLAAFPSHVEPPVIQNPQSPVQTLIEPLSERELEVLRLVAAGLSNSQIAEKLIVTVGTVKRHLNNIFGKLGVGSRTQALVRARELGVIA